MIKIKLFESEIHRNETSFRPLWMIRNELREVGIELFTNDILSYDFCLISQASFINKKIPLYQSVEWALNKLNKITGDYILLDGQDSTSLIGTIDVFRHVYKNNNCKLFLKTSYLKNFDDYKKGWILGRKYWGEGEYSVSDIDDMKSKMKLTGFNWLSTIQPNWNIKNVHKIHDIWAYFQYPMNKEVFEHGILQSAYYDNFRKGLHDKLESLENKYKILRMKDGTRVTEYEYYQMMIHSKIIIAPFGYGEMAPRDIESAMFGSILFKNDMNHIWTIPNPYIPDSTYISIKWDWSDLEEKIDYVLSNYNNTRNFFADNLRQKYKEENDFTKRLIYFYNILKNIDGIETE